MTRPQTQSAKRRPSAPGPELYSLVKAWRTRAKSGTKWSKEYGKLYSMSAAIYLETARELENWIKAQTKGME